MHFTVSWPYIGGGLRCLCGLIVFLHWQNYGLRTVRYVFSHRDMPAGFHGFKIVQISDYHNTSQLQDAVLSITEREHPDIIALTGDLFDCRHTDIAAGLSLAQRLPAIAPTYYVTGNHEARLANADQLKDTLSGYGIKVMDDEKLLLQRNGDFVTLLGAQDPRFFAPDLEQEEDKITFRQKMLSLCAGDNTFKILLSHRPEFIHTYRDAGVVLALTGHAHGGQFGIPFTDMGVFVPNQGLFPKYARGLKQLDNTTEIISRGLGNSAFPFRLFNRPEVVVVEFE